MLLDTPEMDKVNSKRSSQLVENFNDLGEPATYPTEGKNGPEARLSAFLRSENGNANRPGADNSPAHSMTSQHSQRISRNMKPSFDEPSPSEKPPRPSFMSSAEVRTDSNSPGQTVTRPDIRASAEKILYTFVLPGSEREIVLPDSMLNAIIRAIEEEGRDDPEVFDAAKDYVFQAMERDAFPGFLQAKALGNLVPLSVIIVLAAGLASIGAGFWGGFYMILTDQPRHIRCWVCYSLLLVLLLPFALDTGFLILH